MALVVSPISGVTYLPPTFGVQAILAAQRPVLVPETPAAQPTPEPAPQLPTGSPRLTDTVLRSLLFERTASQAAADAAASDTARQDAITRSNALQRAQSEAALADALQSDALETPPTPVNPQALFEPESPATASGLADIPFPDLSEAQSPPPALTAPIAANQTALSQPATAPQSAAQAPITSAPANPTRSESTPGATDAADLRAFRLPADLGVPDAARVARPVETFAPIEVAQTPVPALVAPTGPATPPVAPNLAQPLETPPTPNADLDLPSARSTANLTAQDAVLASTLAAAQPFTEAPATALPTPPLPNAVFTASLINSNELAVPPPVSPAILPDTALSPAELASAAQLAAQPDLGELAANRAALSDIPLDAPLLDPLLNPALQTTPDLAAQLPVAAAPLPPPIVTSPEANQVIADLADAGLPEAQEIDPRRAAVVIASDVDVLAPPPVTEAPAQAAPVSETTTPQAVVVPTLAEQVNEPVIEPAPEPVETAAAPVVPEVTPTPLPATETVEARETPAEAVTRPVIQPALQFSPMLAQYQAIDTMQKYYVAPNGQRLPDVEIPQALRALTPPPIDPVRQVSPISPIVREIRA